MDSSGNIVAKYEYSPFGVQTLASGTYATTNQFRFSSEYYDFETGLAYYNYRYYSPKLGRWLSRDPIAEKGGWNLYGMVSNNPVDYWDELGNKKKSKKSSAKETAETTAKVAGFGLMGLAIYLGKTAKYLGAGLAGLGGAALEIFGFWSTVDETVDVAKDTPIVCQKKLPKMPKKAPNTKKIDDQYEYFMKHGKKSGDF
jgi:RHS repeat-associated protein